MISPENSMRLILRFMDLNHYPEDHGELLKSYLKAFEVDYEAERFTQEWLETSDECPKPSNVYERGRQLAQQRSQLRATNYDCPRCLDSGWLSVPNTHGNFVGKATRCQCLLNAIDRQRAEGKIK